MVIKLDLENAIFRILFFLFSLLVLLLLVKISVGNFIVATLSSRGAPIESAFLISTIEFFPDSGRLFAKLAENELNEGPTKLESAEQHAVQAIKLSPANYSYRLLHAKIRVARGDYVGAETAIREALALAPNNHAVHWQLANLLVAAGESQRSLEHFRFAVELNPALLPLALDTTWKVSGQNTDYLRQIVDGNSEATLRLALFLATQSRTAESVRVFSTVEKGALVSSPVTSPFVTNLITTGYPTLARDLWLSIKSPENHSKNSDVVWNGGFEAPLSDNFNHFGWRLEKNKYARISIDNSRGQAGTSSLLLDFLSLDTTSLDSEVSQLMVLRTGSAYQLIFHVRTENLKSPDDGPRVVLTLAGKGDVIAQSKPISSGSEDWLRMSVDFRAPPGLPNGVPVQISIKRTPRYDFDEPTSGRVWFDNFSIREAGEN